MLAFLQKIGRSLMLPIAILPVAALLFRLGAPDILDIPFVMAAGSAIFDNLPILFAIGIAIGMSDDHRGEAVLAAVVGYYVLLASLTALLIQFGYAASDEIVSKLPANILLGLIAGIVAVWTYNRFRQVKLPTLFRFFSGRRLIPILTSLFGLLIALVLFILWPLLWNGLASFNQTILGWGVFGTAVYSFLNRLLLPIGLHHVLNTYFWFTLGEYSNPLTGQMVAGDIPRFLNGDPTAGVYQVGFYPVMMGGLLGAALAIILAAKEGRRLKIAGFIGSAAFVSLITGITEPLEFAFLFVAPYLYIIHALLTAVSSFITNAMGLRHGFAFSAGLIDYFLNFGLAERPIELLIVAAIFFLVYFLIFFIIIEIFNLKTPGREDQVGLSASSDEILESGSKGKDEGTILAQLLAGEEPGLDSDVPMPFIGQVPTADPFAKPRVQMFIDALGGKRNITTVESTATTRLRVCLVDPSLIDEDALHTAGSRGVIHTMDSIHVLVGPNAPQYAAEMLAQLEEAKT